MQREKPMADVCLILEGTYPYAMGGVANWMHEVIRMQEHLTFEIVALIGPTASAKLLYELPPNVTALHTIRLQKLPRGVGALPEGKQAQLFSTLEQTLLKLQSHAGLADLGQLIQTMQPYREQLGRKLLLDSRAAWDMLLRMYNATMPASAFLDYFWSWRGLLGSLYSVLLCDIPPAKSYHALCTGYAGLLLARAHLETGRPCAITEHGIYTNERRIEIASAEWLDDGRGQSLGLHAKERELRDFWIDMFVNYSRLAYAASCRIVTLYEGNQIFQRMDGAEPQKLQVIPNGIDIERFEAVARVPHPPTVALIGRVVPIKDVKTYLRAVALLKTRVPDLRALILGPADEDPEYHAECLHLAEHLQLGDTLSFLGKVNITEHLGGIDVIALTSLSEAQPLVILEAGAAGVPTVATDVGSCRELILGARSETPQLGAGGAITPVADARAVAEAMLRLLMDPEYYQQCSEHIRARVKRYYAKADQRAAYATLYAELINEGESAQEAA